MQNLIKGIHAFQRGMFRDKRELFERLARQQNPDVLFITCSDSRVMPNELTQTGPGDLFIMRNAGNIIPPPGATSGGEEATIEYAVGALGVKDIIVCGHSRCGAMKALLHREEAQSMPSVSRWLDYAEATRRIMEKNYKHLEGDALWTATVEENVLSQLEVLRTHPAVAAALASGSLGLHGWVYKIETGDVFAFEPSQGQFLPLNEEREQQTSTAVIAAGSRPNFGAAAVHRRAI